MDHETTLVGMLLLYLKPTDLITILIIIIIIINLLFFRVALPLTIKILVNKGHFEPKPNH